MPTPKSSESARAPVEAVSPEPVSAPDPAQPRLLRAAHGSDMFDPFTCVVYPPEGAVEVPSSWVDSQLDAGKLEVV